MLKCHKVHFIGIGGIGLSAIARMMLKQNKIVSGSDLVLSEITKELAAQGAEIFQGHRPENLSSDTSLVIYSPAVGKNNPERLKVEKLGIPQFSYPEFLGELSKEMFTIAVSGTNGKSTTTAILRLILEAAGLDPTVIVGSKVGEWNGNIRLPKCRSRRIPAPKDSDKLGSPGQAQIKAYFVVEACEWRAHMLNLNPQIIVLTNLEEDHLDYYQDINHIVKTFQTYIEKLPEDGILVLNADDKNLMRIKPKSKVITYGIKNPSCYVMAKDIALGSGEQKFKIEYKIPFSVKFRDREISQKGFLNLSIKIPGIFNIYNSLAAVAAALALGVSPKIIKNILENFSGIWRRFEVINAGQYGFISVNQRESAFSNISIISDYAHHPQAIRETIQAARDFYPTRRLVVIFQPHQRSRTKKLFNGFIKSFDRADLTIISEIYSVAGREVKEDQDISSRDLVKAIKKRGKEVYYVQNLAKTKNMVLKNLKPNDLVLIMGAGDIYKLADEMRESRTP